MKILAITGVVAVLVIGGMTFIPSVSETVNKTIEIEKEVEVDALDKRIKEAVESASASTTEKAQKAYDDVVAKETKRIEDEVKADYIAEIESTITDPSY
jgi:molecular chaperone DnaK (HSP70)